MFEKLRNQLHIIALFFASFKRMLKFSTFWRPKGVSNYFEMTVNWPLKTQIKLKKGLGLGLGLLEVRYPTTIN